METKYQILKNDFIDIKHPESRSAIVRLYRIISTKKFIVDGLTVECGAIGGYIQGDHNLSHDGNCWIFHTAKAFENATISGDSYLLDNAAVYGNAMIRGASKIMSNARIRGNTSVVDSIVMDNSDIKGNAVVKSSRIFNSSLIYEDAEVIDSDLYHGAMVHGKARVFNTVMHDVSEIRGNATVYNGRYGGRMIIDDSLDHNHETSFRDIELVVESGKGEK